MVARIAKPKPVYGPAVRPILGWIMTCSECRVKFGAKRSDAKVCSERCRIAKYRRRRG